LAELLLQSGEEQAGRPEKHLLAAAVLKLKANGFVVSGFFGRAVLSAIAFLSGDGDPVLRGARGAFVSDRTGENVAEIRNIGYQPRGRP
jgi:hypothetical protein